MNRCDTSQSAAGVLLPDCTPVLEELCAIVDSAGAASGKLSRALETIARRLGMTRGAISLLAPGTADIHIEIAYGLKAVEQSRGHYLPGEGVTGMVIQSGKPIVVPDVAQEPLFLNRTRARNLRRDHITFFCVPLMVEKQAIGALSVEREGLPPDEESRVTQLLGVAASLLAPYAHSHRTGADGQEASGLAPRGSSVPDPLLLGASPGLRLILARIAQLAPLAEPVLFRGEAGSGKQLAARALHAARYGTAGETRPFVAQDCAALPESLLEQMLFGPSEQKAGTRSISGSIRDTEPVSRWDMAVGGTLFLHEIEELPLRVQARLLQRLTAAQPTTGEHDTCRTSVRLMVATSRDLEAMTRRGTLLPELYTRLAALTLDVPSLRERRNDILPLAHHFLERYAATRHKDNARLSLSAMDMLHRYTWPGNVGELEQTMERAVLLIGSDGLILPHHLPPELHAQDCPACGRPSALGGAGLLRGSLTEHLESLERTAIADALEYADGHMGRAAATLGLTERVMALRMKKYGLRYQDYRLRNG